MAEPMIIDIVSDIVCPWCYVGKKHLEAALTELPDLNVEIHWRPFQLDPTLPPEGVDRNAYMQKKFGDPARLREIHHRLENLGAERGIAFAFDKISRSPNTLDGHRLIRWASLEGKVDLVVSALFQAYFEEGRDIGDRTELSMIAASCGLDPVLISARLASDEDKGNVHGEIADAQRIGVSGVPFFIFARKLATSGAQPPEILADAIRQALGPTPSLSA